MYIFTYHWGPIQSVSGWTILNQFLYNWEAHQAAHQEMGRNVVANHFKPDPMNAKWKLPPSKHLWCRTSSVWLNMMKLIVSYIYISYIIKQSYLHVCLFCRPTTNKYTDQVFLAPAKRERCGLHAPGEFRRSYWIRHDLSKESETLRQSWEAWVFTHRKMWLRDDQRRLILVVYIRYEFSGIFLEDPQGTMALHDWIPQNPGTPSHFVDADLFGEATKLVQPGTRRRRGGDVWTEEWRFHNRFTSTKCDLTLINGYKWI